MTKATSATQVTVTKDGPYIVAGDVPLLHATIEADANGGSDHWSEGAPLEHGSTFALCRCGGSRNKPFCDGTHAQIGFDGQETASRTDYLEQAKTYPGPRLDLTDVETLCAFARFCDTHGKVWNEVAVTDDADVARRFTTQVNNCPSGRLRTWTSEGATAVETARPISIALVEDPAQGCSGPAWLRGGIPLTSADGFHYETRNRVALCRCGASKNKPFCDGSHATIGFKDR